MPPQRTNRTHKFKKSKPYSLSINNVKDLSKYLTEHKIKRALEAYLMFVSRPTSTFSTIANQKTGREEYIIETLEAIIDAVVYITNMHTYSKDYKYSYLTQIYILNDFYQYTYKKELDIFENIMTQRKDIEAMTIAFIFYISDEILELSSEIGGSYFFDTLYEEFYNEAERRLNCYKFTSVDAATKVNFCDEVVDDIARLIEDL